MQVKECMSSGAETIAPDASLRDAVGIMRSRDVGLLPVVENDRMIGTVTDRDIALGAFDDGSRPDQARVRDVMSEGIRWCFEDQDLDEAAKMMNEAQVRRLAVVNREKRLVGTLGLRDVVLDGEPQKAVEILRGVLR